MTKAQQARGASFTHGTVGERFQSLMMLFVPLFQGTLRRSTELATALEARGYEVEGQQTLLHEGPLARGDYLVLILVLLVTIVSLLP